MDALKESCPTKMLLLTSWQSAAEIYSKAVAELSRNVGKLPEDYAPLKRAAEDARRRATEAHAAFERHIQDHRCEGDGEKAA